MIQRQGNIFDYDYIMERFESIDEFISVIESRPIADAWHYNMTAHEVRGESFDRARWYGASGYTEAREKFMYGTKAAKAMQKAYAATQVSRERETVTSVCGCAPIVANALRGLPLSMIDVRHKRTPRVVRVVVNMSINSNIDAAQIERAGKAIIAAVGKLDAAGITTEIVCSADKLLNGRQLSSCGITIKTAGQAFNAARVSFSMSNPAFLRVFQFAHISGKPEAVYDSGYGRSVCYDFSRERLAEFARTFYGNCIYFGLADVVRRGDREIERAIDEWRKSTI